MTDLNETCGGISGTVSGLTEGLMSIIQMPITIIQSIMDSMQSACGGISGK
jgi:hypothetical protein